MANGNELIDEQPMVSDTIPKVEEVTDDNLSPEEISSLWKSLSHKEAQNFYRMRSSKYKGDKSGLYDDEKERRDKIDYLKDIKQDRIERGRTAISEEVDKTEATDSQVLNKYLEYRFGKIDDRNIQETIYERVPGEKGLIATGTKPKYETDDDFENYLTRRIPDSKERDVYKDYLKTNKIDIDPEFETRLKNQIQTYNLQQIYKSKTYKERQDIRTAAPVIKEEIKAKFDEIEPSIADEKIDEFEKKSIDFKNNYSNLEKTSKKLSEERLKLEKELKPILERWGTIDSVLSPNFDKETVLPKAWVGKVTEYENLNAKIDSFVSSDKYKNYLKDSSNLSKNYNFLKNSFEAYNNLVEEAGDIESVLYAASKDYLRARQIGDTLGGFFFGDIPNYITGLMKQGYLGMKFAGSPAHRNLMMMLTPDQMDELNKNDVVYNFFSSMHENTNSYTNKLAKKLEVKYPEPLKVEDVNSLSSFATFFLDAGTVQSPSIATMMIPMGVITRGSSALKAITEAAKKSGTWGGAAIPKIAAQRIKNLNDAYKARNFAAGIFYTSSGGGEIGETWKNRKIAPIVISNLEKKINDESVPDWKKDNLKSELEAWNRRLNISEGLNFIHANIFGAAEGIGEKFGTLSQIGRLGKNAFDTVEKSLLLNVYNTAFKGLGRAITTEFAEETITQTIQSYSRKTFFDPTITIFDGIDANFFATVAATRLIIAGGNRIQNVKNVFADYATTRSNKKQSRKLFNEALEIESQIDDIDARLEIKGVLSPSEIKRLKNEKTNLLNKQSDLLEKNTINRAISMDQYKKLTPSQREILLDIESKLSDIRVRNSRLASLISDPAEKRKAFNQLKNEYESLIDKKDNILKNNSDRIFNEQLQLFKNIEGVEIPSNNKSFELDFQYLTGVNQLELELLNVYAQQKGLNIKVGTLEEIKQWSKENNLNITDELLEGKSAGIVGDNIFVNQELVRSQIFTSSFATDPQSSYAVVSPIHEILHHRLQEIGFVDSKYFDKASSELFDMVELAYKAGSIKEADYKTLMKRKNRVQEGEDNKTKLEEFIIAYNDSLRLGILSRNDLNTSVYSKIFFNSVASEALGDLGITFKIKTGGDLKNFLDNFNKNVNLNKQVGGRVEEPEDEKTTEATSKEAEVKDKTQEDTAEKLARGSEIVADQLGAGIVRFDNTEDFLGAIESLKAEGVDIDLKTNEKGEIEPAEKQSYGLIANLPNGDKQIIINNVSSEADGVLPADKHEVLHAFASKMDPNKLYKMGRDLYNSIINDTGDVTSRFEVDDKVKKALTGYRKKYKAGRISKEKFYEEVMAVVSDGLTRGGVKVKKTGPLINILNNFLENIKFKQSFKDGNQAIEFLKDFNRDVMTGKGLSKETLGKAGVKFSKSEASVIKQELGDKMNDVVGYDSNTTNDQFKNSGAVNFYINYMSNEAPVETRNLLDNLIKKRLRRLGIATDIDMQGMNPNVHGYDLNPFLEEVKMHLYEGTVRRFDPEINDDFAGFLASELDFRIGNISNKYKKGPKTSSLDITPGETGSIRTPVADEVDIDIKTTETLRSELKQGLKINNEQFVDKSLDTELQTNTLEIIEGVTPEIDGKDLITYLKDASQQKSFKTIKNKLKNLNEFLEDNYKVLFHGKNLPIATLVALERKTPVEERIFTGEPTRLTTQNQIDKAVNEGDFHVENEKQGPSRYPRKKPTIEQVLKFFNPPTKNPKTGKPSGLKGTRKDGIVNAIAFSLFRDYAPETMNRASIDPRDIAKVSQRLIVDPTIKFSLSASEASDVAKKIKENSGKSRIYDLISIGRIKKSRIQAAKEVGLTKIPLKYNNDIKDIYDRDKELPKNSASFKGETVLEAATRIINDFLLEHPRYYNFLKNAFTFGIDRSMFGINPIWNKFINPVTPDIKKKKEGDVKLFKGEPEATYRKANMAKNKIVSKTWIEETKEEGYTKKELQKSEDLISFIKDFDSYLNKEVNEILVYNASPKSFDKLGERTGLIYLTTNKREADAYAESNRGEVKNIFIDNDKIASEQELINTMKEIGVNTSEGLTYELIDSRFENYYIGKKAMDKVKNALLQKGFKAARYKDGAQVVSGKVESIVVFDKSVISDKKGKINNNKDTWFLDEFAMHSQNSMTTPTKTAAGALTYEIKNGNKNKPFNGLSTEEHFDPQNEIITALIGGIKDGNFEQVSNIIRASYIQGLVSDANNDRVNEDFKSTKPDLFYEGVELLLQGKLELDPGLLSVIRYTESDVNLNNLYYIPTKQTYGEYFFDANNLPLKTQKELIRDLFKGELTLKDLRDYGKIYNSVGKQTVKAFKSNLKQPNVKKYSFSKSAGGLFNDLNNHDKALRNARDLNAPKKGISIFDFDDTVATSKSMIIVTMPEEIQKITGTGNAVKVINTVYKGAVDLIAKNKKIESINFTSDAAESSRIKLYNTLANKLKKDLGWSLDLFETTGFGKKESEDFTLTKPKKQKNIKTLGSNLNFIEDTVGNFKSSFEINNRTYNVSLDKKGEGDYDLNFSLIGESKGKTFKLTPQQFAKQHSDLELQGAEFDFSEFNKVIDGKPGPLAAKIKKQIDKFGNKDVYILTARPQVSATSIKAFLDGIGINIPLKNITGLENGSPQAKANWVIGKAADGYNDFYFTDDVYKNVKAVQEALEVLDVKSKTRLAYADRIKKLDKDFNDILEATTGVGSEKEYSKVKAELLRGNKGRYEFFIHASADDFAGLLQRFEGKGVVGDNAKLWFKKNLLDPFATAMGNLSRERVALMSDYDALKKQIGIVPKNLRKKMGEGIFTNEHAVRVYIWNKQGMEVPGLSKRDLKELTKYINNNKKFKVFADQLIAIHKADGYPKADSAWSGGTITLDMQNGLDVSSRAKNLQAWEQNVDIIFSDKNLNKIEALYGQPLREALTGMIKRMKTGKNRSFQSDTLTGKTVDFLNGAVGGVMFFNSRSSVLQTISLVNFINYEDNNIFAASKAFANQKQFWKDFKKLMNSDFLIDRRRGVRFSLNENDIANIAQKHGARGVIARALEIGFLPTQIADSFAIAVGGASFYRNRINTYKKQGLSDQQAEAKAFQNFREIAEETQQSSRPDRVSQQQAGPMGRLLLAFQNVTMQFNRVGKKNFLDLKNGRRVLKFDGTFHSLNKSRQIQLSKMGYYFFVQNLIFNALQKALFALYFGDVDEEDEKFKNKYIEIANSMVDSILRGTGIFGGVISVIKNAAIMHQKQAESPNPKYEKVGLELLKVSPPISSKISKVVSAVTTLGWEKEEIKEKGFSIDNPALLSATKLISAFTNAPLDRVVIKTNNIATALGQQLELWERIALLGGWQDWELGIEDEPKSKTKRRKTKKRKVKKRKTK